MNRHEVTPKTKTLRRALLPGRRMKTSATTIAASSLVRGMIRNWLRVQSTKKSGTTVKEEERTRVSAE